MRPNIRQLSFLWDLFGPWLRCGVHREFPRQEALLRISFPLANLPRQERTLGNAAQDDIFRQEWDKPKALPWADGRAGPRGTGRRAVVRLMWDPGERARCWEGLGHESRLVRGEHEAPMGREDGRPRWAAVTVCHGHVAGLCFLNIPPVALVRLQVTFRITVRFSAAFSFSDSWPVPADILGTFRCFPLLPCRWTEGLSYTQAVV